MLKDAVPLGECGRALVVKLRHHGDVLLAAPVLAALKARGVEVDALVYDDTAPMLEGHPALSQLHVVGRKWRSAGLARLGLESNLLASLRRRSYGLLVHLSEASRGAWLARLLGVRYSVAPRVAHRGGFWTKSFTHFYPLIPRRHQVEVNLDALRRIGLQPEVSARKVEFVPGAAAETKVAALVGEASFVHVHPASRWRFKCWPADKNAQLIERLERDGHRVVLTAAPDSEELAFVQDILARSKAKVLNLAGQLSIKELGALTGRAKAFFGVDSMPMHLAAAMGTPSVVLFGPSGELEWGPWNVPHRIVRSAHSCRPCGYDGCGSGKVSECLTVLSVDDAHAALRELLAR